MRVTGCKKFDELNTDPAKPGETRPEFLLSSAEKRAADIIYGGYYNGRIGMHFAQYWTGTDKTSESRNFITDDGLWANLYSGPLMDLQEISNYYTRNPEMDNSNMKAAAAILKTWIFHVLTDVYVDVPYSQALQVTTFPQPVFDKAQEIYTSLLNTLKEQISVLESTDQNVIDGDILLGGDKTKWIKFANALRMRIAMRMADVDEQGARTEIEAAAKNTLAEGDDVFFPVQYFQRYQPFPL